MCVCALCIYISVFLLLNGRCVLVWLSMLHRVCFWGSFWFNEVQISWCSSLGTRLILLFVFGSKGSPQTDAAVIPGGLRKRWSSGQTSVCLPSVLCLTKALLMTDDVMYECWAQLCLMSDSFVRNPDETQIELDVCRDSLLFLALLSVFLLLMSEGQELRYSKHFSFCSEFRFDWAETQRCWL